MIFHEEARIVKRASDIDTTGLEVLQQGVQVTTQLHLAVATVLHEPVGASVFVDDDLIHDAGFEVLLEARVAQLSAFEYGCVTSVADVRGRGGLLLELGEGGGSGSGIRLLGSSSDGSYLILELCREAHLLEVGGVGWVDHCQCQKRSKDLDL